jgi:murein DD-endopeptidase MepM/ murein hydrolase activator NlpD
LGRTAAPFALFSAFVLIVPAIGTPSSLQPMPDPEPLRLPPAAERALADVLNDRLAISRLPAPPAAATAAWGSVAAARVAPDAIDTPRSHTVREGETLWSISRRHDVSVDALARANNLADGAILRVGRALVIPAPGAPVQAAAAEPPVRSAPRLARVAGRTVQYTVEPGDSLWSIAERHGTTVDDVMALNDLDDPDRLRPGQRLVISGRPLPRTGPAAAPRRVAPRQAEPEMADDAALRTAGAFLWPSRGVLTSRFGLRRYRRHHDGIDIAAPHGTPIYASRDGVVEYSGWKAGYGRVVFLEHGGGLVTVYGHASKLLVRAGEKVKKGQLIAHVGCTGRCTGAHLHFEVRINGAARNPLRYLQ